MPAVHPMAKLIGEQLVHKGLLSTDELRAAVDQQRMSGAMLGEVLVARGLLTETQVVEVLSEQLGIPFVDVSSYEIEPDVLQLIPEKLMRQHVLLPLFRVNKSITVAMADPLDVRATDRLRFLTRGEIDPVFGSPTAINEALDRYFKRSETHEIEEVMRQIQEEDPPTTKSSVGAQPAGTRPQRAPASQRTSAIAGSSAEVEGNIDAAEKAPVIKLVDTILKTAADQRASDIHIEPDEDGCRLRYRIDGILTDQPQPPTDMKAAIISRVKILADMDIAERRLPQDGRFQKVFDAREVDYRISTFPTIHGENVVIRVLDKSSSALTIDQIGFLPTVRDRFQALANRPNGIILVTGPTGCGKTTTLYAALRTVDATKLNVITLEDPVEYRIARIRQSQVDVKAGLTFANGLRSILRQDPDVIMIGEIRDCETAEISIHAALTGHLVFSTLHTNDAPGAVTRLIDMGIEPFLVASSIIGVMAQRLVRVLCPKCKEAFDPPPEMLKRLGIAGLRPGQQLYRAKGCDACQQSGYHGRMGIFELLEMTEAIRQLTTRKAAGSELRAQAIRDGMAELQQAGITKAFEGVTSIEEVLRVTDISARVTE